MNMLKTGDVVPKITLNDQHGEAFVLQAKKGKRLLITFYVKDSTPACTQQVCELAALAGSELDVVAIGPGTVKTHEKFAAAQKVRVPMLVDEADAGGSLRAAKAFGVWGEKSMYGKKYMGVVRSSVLIGSDGRVERVWGNIKVKGHAEAVREALGGEEGGLKGQGVKKPVGHKRVAKKVQGKRAGGGKPEKKPKG